MIPKPSTEDDGTVTFAIDANTGNPATMPQPPDQALVAELLSDARALHTALLVREASIVERQYRVAQLWLAAVALSSASGLFGATHADLWLALGFSLGFGLSVLLIGPQAASLLGYALSDFNDPDMLGKPEHTRLVLLSTWQEVIARSEAAIETRVKRFALSVRILAVFTPVAILARLL